MKPHSFQRITQITDSHCGPAVLEMLLDFYHIKTSQDEIVRMGGAKETLTEYGMGIDELSMSLQKLTPDYLFWYKEDATVQEIETLLHEHNVPVAVDWQGFFYDSLEEEGKLSSNLAHGHYCIITEVDHTNNTITLVDPYYEFTTYDRTFPIGWFKSRWWDVAEEMDPVSKKELSYYTSRLLFIVVPKNETFPEKMGLHQVPADYLQQKFAEALRSHPHHPPYKPKKHFPYAWERFVKSFKNLVVPQESEGLSQ